MLNIFIISMGFINNFIVLYRFETFKQKTIWAGGKLHRWDVVNL